MAVVLNARNEEVHIQAHGNWFKFAPKQIKIMQPNLAMFLCTVKAEDGFVALPDAFEEPEYRETPEGKAAFKDAEKRGINRFLQKMQEVVQNNTISMDRDLKMSNIATDPREFMSDGEMKALETLAQYKDRGEDDLAKRVDRARELEKKLGIK